MRCPSLLLLLVTVLIFPAVQAHNYQDLEPCRKPQCPYINMEFSIYLPDPCRCSSFYICDWGVAVPFECPAGLHFNAELQVCDYPESAGCEWQEPMCSCPAKNDELVTDIQAASCFPTSKDASLSGDAVPYRIQTSLSADGSETAMACFNVQANSSIGLDGNSCGSMNIDSIHLIVDPACCAQVDTLTSATINGVAVKPSCNTNKWAGRQPYGTMAFDGLASHFPTVPEEGLQLCMTLQTTSSCGTVQDLCYGNSCIYSLAAGNNPRCCLVEQASEVGLTLGIAAASASNSASSSATTSEKKTKPTRPTKPSKPTKPVKPAKPTKPT